MEIGEYLEQAGIPFAIVTRGYKAGYEDMGTSVLQHHHPEDVGDEAILFKTRFPNGDIYMGKNRLKSIEAAIENQNKVILLDDGFQTTQLHKDLKIMLFNPDHPYYYLRNFRFMMKREDIVLYYRCDDYLPAQKGTDEKEILTRTTNTNTSIYGSYDFTVSGFYDMEQNPVEIEKTSPVIFGFSALGDNERFKKDLSGFNLAGFVPFKDHHSYTEEDILSLNRQREENGARYLVCTEKDLVKIKRYNLSKIPLIYLQNSIKFNFDLKSLILKHAAGK
jgi:tetraacyldisaccharide 4'-kinase